MLDKLKSFFKKTAAEPAIINTVLPLSPMLGDRVSHEGKFAHYEIIAKYPRAVMTEAGPSQVELCEFSDDKVTIKCLYSDLVWLKEDKAWMLPGRLLDTNLKARWREHMTKHAGIQLNYGPHEDKHIEARDFLRAVGVLSNG